MGDNDFLFSLLRPLLVQDRVDADATRQVGCKQAVRIESSLDCQEIPVAREDAVELLGRQDLVLGEVNLAAAPDVVVARRLLFDHTNATERQTSAPGFTLIA